MMKKSWLTFAALLTAGTVAAQETEPVVAPYDENATAQSLGLTRYDAPVFPVFPSDNLKDWGAEYQTIEEGIASMAECECSLPAFVADARGVELAKKNGLKCIYDATPIETFDQRDWTEEQIQKKLEALDAQIKERVQSTKDDPDVLGYYLCDEPGAYYNRALATVVAAVKKYAPGKLAYINLYPGYASTIGADVDSQLGTYLYREYLERFVQEVKPQLLSYDNYMVEYSEDMRDVWRGTLYFTDLFEVRRVALKYELPFWCIASCLCILPDSSAPTPTRLAFQAYSALAAGAEGLAWFMYYPLDWKESPIDSNGNKTLTWLYLRDINVQTKTIGTYLRAYRSTECGVDPLAANDEDAKPTQLPQAPKNVLKNVTASFSSNAKDYGKEPKLMIGEFAQKDGDNVTALCVNLDFETAVKVKFEKPDGCKTVKVVSPIDGSEQLLSDEDLENGAWIVPGHGKLFVCEK